MITPRQRFALFIATRFYLITPYVRGMRPAWWLVDNEVACWLKDYDKTKRRPS